MFKVGVIDTRFNHTSHVLLIIAPIGFNRLKADAEGTIFQSTDFLLMGL